MSTTLEFTADKIKGLGKGGKYELIAETMKGGEHASWSLVLPNKQMVKENFNRCCRLHERKDG